MGDWVFAGTLQSLKEKQVKVIKGGIALFYHEDQVYALDNRCPHMGFPLHMGSLCQGMLTCHWHHARFDINSGGTLDPWADDVPAYEVKVENGEVWVHRQREVSDPVIEYKKRLQKGLEQNLSIVIAKAVVGLVKLKVPENEIIEIGINYGTRYRKQGWGPGLTILTAMANVLPKLDEHGKIQALYQGLLHVARDCRGQEPYHHIGALQGYQGDLSRLASWYRDCVEVRDIRGAERVLLTAIQQGMQVRDLSKMMLTAVSDHFYLDGGHTLDFHNKAFEALHLLNPQNQESILSSLTPLFANATRSEELHRWQSPVDLVTPLKEAFDKISKIPDSPTGESWDEESLLEALLADQPLDMIETLTSLLSRGASPIRVAQVVALAAAERIKRFHTQNDFSDWITVLHTFTHAHAVHQSFRRVKTHPELIRAIYHGAVSIYLDRFLNIPVAKTLKISDTTKYSLETDELLQWLDKQQQVQPAAEWVLHYLQHQGDLDQLFNALGHAVLREDANFHTYQMYEAACVEFDIWNQESTPLAEKAKETLILALVRYLAAHAPTAREIPRVANIALRLYAGEKVFQENEC